MTKRKRFIHDRPGVVDDLEDQAEWSSYGSHIPRLGHPRRQRIWRNRIHRGWARSPFLVVLLGLAAFLAFIVLLAWVFSLLGPS